MGVHCIFYFLWVYTERYIITRFSRKDHDSVEQRSENYQQQSRSMIVNESCNVVWLQLLGMKSTITSSCVGIHLHGMLTKRRKSDYTLVMSSREFSLACKQASVGWRQRLTYVSMREIFHFHHLQANQSQAREVCMRAQQQTFCCSAKNVSIPSSFPRRGKKKSHESQGDFNGSNIFDIHASIRIALLFKRSCRDAYEIFFDILIGTRRFYFSFTHFLAPEKLGVCIWALRVKNSFPREISFNLSSRLSESFFLDFLRFRVEQCAFLSSADQIWKRNFISRGRSFARVTGEKLPELFLITARWLSRVIRTWSLPSERLECRVRLRLQLCSFRCRHS